MKIDFWQITIKIQMPELYMKKVPSGDHIICMSGDIILFLKQNLNQEILVFWGGHFVSSSCWFAN